MAPPRVFFFFFQIIVQVFFFFERLHQEWFKCVFTDCDLGALSNWYRWCPGSLGLAIPSTSLGSQNVGSRT